MEFVLLGSVDVRLDGQAVDVGHPRQRCVLAALLVDANRVLTVDALADRLWGDKVPPSARNVVAGCVSRLRRALTGVGDVQLIRRSGGYAALVDPDLVDLHRFRRLMTEAGATGDDHRRVARLEAALALWQGSALDGLTGEWCTAIRQALAQERLSAQLAYHEVQGRLGRCADSLPGLYALATEHPLDERVAGRLMLAAYRSGDQAAAFETYQHIRARLAEELGVDPGPQLRDLHQQLLRNDPALVPPATPVAVGVVAPAAMVPSQLPADVAGFAGRSHHLAQLDHLLERTVAQSTTVVISAIAGTAGVGKTALAVHWAHRVRRHFPDGQLYVNLRGFHPTGSMMDPAEAIRGFLDALGVPAQRIPGDLDAQAALYRSHLAEKRILVVLDNARDTGQVRPLLPAASGCLALVTSRNQLTGLVAAEGAEPLTLDLLATDESRQLLIRRLGADRVAAEPDAVDQLISACARLPLALAIVAAHAATQPQLPLIALAGQLRSTKERLDTLSTDDPVTDVRAVFSRSYEQLTPAAARLFQLLGLHPGPDITLPAAASLAGQSPPQVRPLLAELTRAHLVTEHEPGRYTLHDLLHAYATEQAHQQALDLDRRAALHRVLDHYLHTAHAAARLLNPHRHPITLTPPGIGVTHEQLTDDSHALDWFTAEHRVLLAAIEHAADSGFDTHTWQLTWTLASYLDLRGHWHSGIATCEAALAAAQRSADRAAQAWAHRILGHALQQLGRDDDAVTHLHHAMDLFGELADHTGQANTHVALAALLDRRGRHGEALHHSEQAHDLFRAAGNRAGQANALNAIGWCHTVLGHHREALAVCQHALDLHQDLGDRVGVAATWDSLGYAHHHLGHHTRAVACFQHALDLRRDLGDRYHEATTLARLGDTHHAAGNPDAARTAWQTALDILTGLNHPDADDLRTRLTRLRDDRPPTDEVRCAGPLG